MATGDRRLGSSTRRGMTVLGKIPAVPKPINLPSQRLENRGLDPSVEIVPRGTFSWGSGRSPPTSGSSWGNAGLSSSPPVGTGAWNTASMSLPTPSSSNSGGSLVQNPPRPLSAGSTRPLSAGSTRPLSASTTAGRAWGNAAKLEEQIQPSRFNLTTAEFPTLGSEKNPNLRPQQTPSNRPTSADATKERHLTYTGTYQSGMSVDRPTSADGSKERRQVYTEVSHVDRDRPTSADGTHPDKGRHQSALRLPICPPFVDGTLPDQRHAFYTGVVGHGTAGPGPGTLDQPKDNYSNHSLPMQHGIAPQGRGFVFPGAPQHDVYFNRPGGPHGNDVVVLPMDSKSEAYGGYHFDSRPNHPDLSRVHHPQPSWGPNHLDRPGVNQGQFLQKGPSEHFNIMQQPHRHPMENAMLHERPLAGNRRDSFSIGDQAFGEQRTGWAGRNVVYMGPSADAREPTIPMTGTGQELPRPDTFLPSWGHQSMHAGWGHMYGGEMTVGMYQETPPVIQQQTKLIERLPQGSNVEEVSQNMILEESNDKGTGYADEVAKSSPFGHIVSGNPSARVQSIQNSKQEETSKISSMKPSAAGPDILRKRNNAWASEGPLVGTQLLKNRQEDEGRKAEQNKEPQKIHSISNKATLRQEENCYEKLQGSDWENYVAKDNNNGFEHDAKDTPSSKKLPSLQKSTKGVKKADSPVHEREERAPLLKASDRNMINRNNLSTADLSATSDRESSTDLKEACTDGGQHQASTNDLKVTPTPNFMAPAGAPISEKEKVPLDDVSKTRRNGHPVRRAHHGRPMHDPHSGDRQHINHGLVWAPKPMAVGAIKEEGQVSVGGDAGGMHEPLQKISTDIGKKRLLQPSLEHESQGENEVQHTQSAATSSQQGQAVQVQEQSVVSSKRPVQQVQHKRAERSSKKQGHKIQQQQQTRSSVSEQLVSEEQSMCKNPSVQMKHQQSVEASYVELGEPQSQMVTIGQRETQSKQSVQTEETERAGEVISTPVLDKVEGKRHKEEGTVYVCKQSRNQQRPPREHNNEATSNHYVQQVHSKGEKPATDDQDNSVSETSALSATKLRKNQKEVRSRSSRNLKHQKGDLHDSAASLGTTDGHVSSVDKYQVEVSRETCVPSLAVEPKAYEDKEEGTYNQKLVRQQEVHTKQIARGSHQEERHSGEELKADALSCESSTIKSEKSWYVPKQARKQSLQQESEAPGQQVQGGHGQMNQEVHSSNDKAQHDRHGSQPLGAQSNKKNDIERYTPWPARQLNMQGHQSALRSQRGHRTVDFIGGEAIRASSGHVATESSSRELVNMSDSLRKCDELQISSIGQRDERKVHEISELGPSKKHYIVKPTGQQQQSSSVDDEVPVKEKKWQRSNRALGSESIKSKEGIKLYTPVPARQAETSVAFEGKVVKETGELSFSEQQDPVRDGKEKNREIDCPPKDGNHAIKTPNSAPFHRPHRRTQPQPEVKKDTQQALQSSSNQSEIDETNGGIKETTHSKDQETCSYQKNGSRRGNSDLIEDPSLGEVDVAKPRQFQRRHYQYKPVAQHLQTAKLQMEDSNTHRSVSTRSVDQGQNRFEKREGPRRGRGHGYGYRAAEHADSSDSKSEQK